MGDVLVDQIGLPPRRIDILTSVSGVTFDEARASSVAITQAGLALPVIGHDALVRNKRAASRPKDLIDADALEALSSSSDSVESS